MCELDEIEIMDSNGKLAGYSDCLDMLRRHQAKYKSRIRYLEEENRKLKDEQFKDTYIQKLQADNKRILDDARRGFPVTVEEDKSIRKWQETHLREKHPEALEDPSYFGAIGGNWTYIFIPTSIGTIGEVRCHCGEKYCFSDLF